MPNSSFMPNLCLIRDAFVIEAQLRILLIRRRVVWGGLFEKFLRLILFYNYTLKALTHNEYAANGYR